MKFHLFKFHVMGAGRVFGRTVRNTLRPIRKSSRKRPRSRSATGRPTKRRTRRNGRQRTRGAVGSRAFMGSSGTSTGVGYDVSSRRLRIKRHRPHPSVQPGSMTAAAPRYAYANVSAKVPSSGFTGRQYVELVSFGHQPDLDAVFGTDTDTDNRNEKFLLMRGSINLHITSAANVPQTVDIYKFVTIKDSDRDPVTLWKAGCDDKGLGSGGAGINFVGQTPWFSDSFNEYYKVVHHKKYSLGGGGTFTSVFKKPFNRITDRGDWSESTYVKGLSFGFIIVVKGALGWATTESKVAYTQPEILYWAERNFTYKVLAGANKSQVKIVPSIPTGTNITVMNVENDSTDVPSRL